VRRRLRESWNEVGISEFVNQVGKFGMSGGIVNVAEHPEEKLFHFGTGGFEAGKVFEITPLIAIQGGG